MNCPKCGKKATILPYGGGYVAVCCGEAIHNAKTMTEAADAKS